MNDKPASCINAKALYSISLALFANEEQAEATTLLHALMQSQMESMCAAGSINPNFAEDHKNPVFYTLRDGTVWMVSDGALMDADAFKAYETDADSAALGDEELMDKVEANAEADSANNELEETTDEDDED